MRALSALCVAGVLAAPPALGAEPQSDRFALAWVRAPGAEGCVSSGTLAGMVERTVGQPLVTPAHATVLIDGIIAPKRGSLGWQVLIRATTASGEPIGERRLDNEDPRCSETTRSALLVLAMMIDPDVAGRGLPAEVSDELTRSAESSASKTDADALPVATVPNPQPDLPSEEPRPAARRPAAVTARAKDSVDQSPVAAPRRYGAAQSSVSAGAAMSFEFAPKVTYGLAAAVEVAFAEDYSLVIEGAFFPPRRFDLPLPTINGSELASVLELDAEACRELLGRRRVSAAACAGVTFGIRMLEEMHLVGRPYGSNNFTYLGPLAALRLGWFVTPRWFVDARAHATWLPTRESWSYADAQGQMHDFFSQGPFSGYVAFATGVTL